MDPTYVELLQVVVLPACLLLARWLVQDLLAWYSRRPEKEQQFITEALRTAVFAAEQLGKTRLGVEKRQFALDTADHILVEHGIKLDWRDLTARVEAAVYDEINRYRSDPKPAIELPTAPLTT